jgi:SAM-dependent methyltransferase
VFTELGSAVYLGFEDRFRGTTGDIRGRLASYVPLLASASGVLDIGCGRGELLEILRERGVTARGIDTNQAMVDECRSRGLEVERADAVAFLEGRADGALGGLVAIQVVEHFEPAYLLRFLELAYQKLAPGAPLVLETINPACWMAFFECYLRDLTHARALHPDTLRYLVQASGFASVNIEYRSPVTEADRRCHGRNRRGRQRPRRQAQRTAVFVDGLRGHRETMNSHQSAGAVTYLRGARSKNRSTLCALPVHRTRDDERGAHASARRKRPGYITEAECVTQSTPYEEIAKMLTGLIRHLEREDRPRRG